uniref:hypothetical protein n=1 Tax=Phenylobacterium sp. TaxID=1871053 RepID=UPI00286DC870
AATPQVFVRAFSIPSGMPWEQARAATLEAHHGAPLPIEDLICKVRRLAPWGPRRAGRYAAFYVRRSEFRDPFDTLQMVDGARLRVSFGSSRDQVRQTQMAAVAIGLIVATGAALGGGLMMALDARAKATGRLEADEILAAGQARAAEAQHRRKQQALELRAAIGNAQPVDRVLADLAWASASKAPEARISALHWEHGLMAVEVRGPAAPFVASDRLVERSAQPVRSGVWLWGVIGPDGLNDPGGRPTRTVQP